MMEVIDWPDDLRPSSMVHYLQPHIGGTESPLTRVRKVYGLSAPRWVARMTFQAGHRGGIGVQARGARLDALIAEMEGGLVGVRLWDFRRPYPAGLARYYEQRSGQRYSFTRGETFTLGERFVVPATAEPVNEPATRGATEIVFCGFVPGETVFDAGDYFGGDGRNHLILRPGGTADQDGRARVRFRPPLAADLPAGAARTMQPTTDFQLVGEDAGQAEAFARRLSTYTLDFTEVLPRAA